ncbi:MAG: aminotransferase class IV family protein [Proteobacteria bacterium]|nr:aminotransferase class IV family protein [Pseudomonadota bacterium]
MLIHLNGALVSAADARVDPADRGLTLGDGLFETIRARDGRPLRLAAHCARLRAGADVLDLPVPVSDEALGRALEETLKANAVTDGVLRLTLTRGPGPRGLLPPPRPRPTLLITAAAEASSPSPIRAVIATKTRRNEHSPLSRCKCINYLDNILARLEAAKRGADDALMLNTAGRLAGTTIANLFLVIDGVVVTPPVADGALPGVIRAEVLAAAGAEERSLKPEDLASASEAFITNCLGIRAVVSVDGAPIGDGRPGPVFEKFRAIP